MQSQTQTFFIDGHMWIGNAWMQGCIYSTRTNSPRQAMQRFQKKHRNFFLGDWAFNIRKLSIQGEIVGTFKFLDVELQYKDENIY